MNKKIVILTLLILSLKINACCPPAFPEDHSPTYSSTSYRESFYTNGNHLRPVASNPKLIYSISYADWTELHDAVNQGSIETVKNLLDAGAKVDAVAKCQKCHNRPNYYDYPPSYHGHCQDSCSISDGHVEKITPIELARKIEHRDIEKLLITYKNKKNSD